MAVATASASCSASRLVQQLRHSSVRPMLAHPRRPVCTRQARNICRVVKAEAQQEEPLEQFSKTIGLPTDEGIFGFKPFAEVWTGRLAMMGFLTSVVEEFLTGRGTLQQIGLATPSPPLLTVILSLTTLVTLIATAQTFIRAQNGSMSTKEQLRYRKFLGLTGENNAISSTQTEMKDAFAKGGGDFTAPLNLKAVEEAKRTAKPVDQFLNLQDRKGAAAEGAAAKSTVVLEKEEDRQESGMPGLVTPVDILEQDQFQSGDARYARSIEVNNGRWAMLGFWFCVAVEAGTGQGIIGQVISYLKFLNVLGAESGF